MSRTYKMDEEKLLELIEKTGVAVKIHKREAGPDKEITYKAGERRSVVYESKEIDKRLVENAIAHVKIEDVYKTKKVPTKILTFTIDKEEDEEKFNEGCDV